MGQSPDQTVKEIELARERLDADLRQLERRLPLPPAPVTVLGTAAGSGAVLWLVARGIQRLLAARQRARSLVGAPPLVGPPPSRAAWVLQERRWTGWAAGAAGLWLALRLAEIWQLRRLAQTLKEARPHS